MTHPGKVTLQKLQKFIDPATGTLSVAESHKQVPFEIRRSFVLYDLKVGCTRARHAHRVQSQFLIAMHGRIKLSTTQGTYQQDFTLAQPDQGVYLPPLTWICVEVLEPQSVYMVLCSGNYDEGDYIRDFEEFRKLTATA